MESNNSQQEKKAKALKPNGYANIRIRKETRRRMLLDLAKINKKDFGKNVRTDEYVAFALSLITPDHIFKLQEGSLSNGDRLDRDYRAYIAQHGPMSKDEYLGKRLSGEISSQSQHSDQDGNTPKTA